MAVRKVGHWAVRWAGQLGTERAATWAATTAVLKGGSWVAHWVVERAGQWEPWWSSAVTSSKKAVFSARRES